MKESSSICLALYSSYRGNYTSNIINGGNVCKQCKQLLKSAFKHSN